jgi:hypothetical protein
LHGLDAATGAVLGVVPIDQQERSACALLPEGAADFERENGVRLTADANALARLAEAYLSVFTPELASPG